MFSWGEAGELGFVKFWQCSARCVFFMVRQVWFCVAFKDRYVQFW